MNNKALQYSTVNYIQYLIVKHNGKEYFIKRICVCIYEVAQSCLTLCDPVDCSLPGSSVHRILQARILEWVAISFSRGSSCPREPRSPALQADALPSEPPGEHIYIHTHTHTHTHIYKTESVGSRALIYIAL